MKKTLFALAIIAIFSFTGIAQNANQQKRGPEKVAEKMTERMAENLNLTEDQKTAVYEANFQMASTRKKNQKANKEKHEANLKEILTEEQYEKWKAMKKDHKANRTKNKKPN